MKGQPMKKKRTQYKSPDKKLVVFFEDSRDNWRDKAEGRQKKIRDLNTKIRDLTHSREQWKEKAKALESELSDIKKSS